MRRYVFFVVAIVCLISGAAYAHDVLGNRQGELGAGIVAWAGSVPTWIDNMEQHHSMLFVSAILLIGAVARRRS